MMQVAEPEVGASGRRRGEDGGEQRQVSGYEFVGMCPARRANAAAKRCRDMGRGRNRDRNDVARRGLPGRRYVAVPGGSARPDESESEVDSWFGMRRQAAESV